MHLLIDSDSLLYKAGFVCNGEDQEHLAIWQLDELIQGILKDTNCKSYEIHISGSENFRYGVHPAYKDNRSAMARPIHLQAMREHLVVKRGAIVSCGIEADDAVGIGTYSCGPHEVVVAHIDKDIDMIPGRHYNYNKKTWYDVNEMDAMRWFFTQLILGDKTDNIPGYDGKMRPKCPKFLEPAIKYLHQTDSFDDMLQHVYDMYGDWDKGNWDKLNMSAQCLWIWRRENDDWRTWQNPQLIERLTMEGSGQPVDLIPLSRQSFVPVPDDGNPSMLV
jgi:5'-3' exonuclease